MAYIMVLQIRCQSLPSCDLRLRFGLESQGSPHVVTPPRMAPSVQPQISGSRMWRSGEALRVGR